MLNAIVFVCGAALMGLELVAARVLAPFLGNSIYVWGSVISVVMIALSLGYWLGGIVADSWGPRRTLPPVIAGAGLATVVAPVIAAAVLPTCADLGPRLGSLAAAGLVFFAPALLLAMVSPLGVRMAADRGMSHLGRSTGSLYAVSTAGSIAGTLATSFWLIPLMSIEPLIVSTGFALCATSLLALGLPGPAEEILVATRPRRASALGAVVLVTTGVLVGGLVLWRVAPAPAQNENGETVLFRTDTQYHRITVTEDAETRHLRFDRSHQSAIDLSDPYESKIAYPDYMHLALAIKPDAKRVLVLGLGGGAITKRFWRDYPEMSIDSVEIDQEVVDVARRYFWLPRDPRLEVYAEDARRYVQKTDRTYDVVIVDAYYADALPYHLTTAEFLGEVKARMTPDGVLAYNVVSAVEGPGSKLFRSLHRTTASVWDNLWAFSIGHGEGADLRLRTNTIVLASDASVAPADLDRRIRSALDGRVSIEGFETFADDLYTTPIPFADVPLLTDSHAPTDALIEVD